MKTIGTHAKHALALILALIMLFIRGEHRDGRRGEYRYSRRRQ